MQYYTPPPSGGQAHAGNPFSETQASCRPPQIVGEGDVASLVLPDGSIQLYFVPFPRGPPSSNYPPFINQQQQPPWNSYPEAWLIRSVPDQLIPCPNPNVSRPQCQPDNSNPLFLQSRYQSRTGYQLKFHNDSWTSTTDINQFRQRAWVSAYNTGTQVASPQFFAPAPLSDGCQTVDVHPCLCEKPCHCFNSYSRPDQVHNIFVGTTYEPEKNNIVQIPRSDFQTGGRSPRFEVLHDNEKKSTRLRRSRSRSSRGCDSECRERVNQTTATYVSAATGSPGEASATQTGCGAGVPVRCVSSFFRATAGAAPELWFPASPAARAALACDSGASSAAGSDD